MRWWTTLSNRVKEVEQTVIEEGNPDENFHQFHCHVESVLNDFTSTKQNTLGHVSSWLLSERRENRIDDFVQEMEINGFWLLDRRKSIAQTHLKNVAFKNEFHRETKFKTINELVERKSQCIFRPLNCRNEGCSARFCVVHKEKHEKIAHSRSCPANSSA